MNIHHSQGWHQGIAAAALAALALFPLPAAQGQTPKYSVTNLGTLVTSSENDRVIAMSSNGSVVGTLYYASKNSTITKWFYWNGTMHELPGTPMTSPISVNSSGMVLLGISSAAVWTLAGGKVSLPAPGGQTPAAYAMNDDGVVAGFSNNPNALLGIGVDGSPEYACIGLRWARDMTGAWAYTQLPPLAGHNFSRSSFGANAIDQSGNVIGISAIASLDPASWNPILTDLHAVLWDSALAAHDLGALPHLDPHGGTYPVDSCTDAFFQTRFVWNLGPQAYYSDGYGTTQLVGSGAASPSAAAKGVNVLGQVAGVATFAGGSHAFYWDTTPNFSSGAAMDLGVLPGMSASSLTSTSFGVHVIDDGGFIVGISSNSASKAFLSTPASRATAAKLLDLNLLLSNTLASVGLSSLTEGISINNGGFIICNGISTAAKGGGNVYKRAVLLKRMP